MGRRLLGLPPARRCRCSLDDSSTLDFASRVAADAGIKFAFVSRSKPPFTPAAPTFFLEDFPGIPEELNESAGHGTQ